MLFCSLVELDSLLSLIMLIIYGLLSLKSTQINLLDVFYFCRLFPIIFVIGFYIDGIAEERIDTLLYSTSEMDIYSDTLPKEYAARLRNDILNLPIDILDYNQEVTIFESTLEHQLPLTLDVLLAILLFFVIYNFQSFESVLLLLFAFIGQYYMLHSIDLLSFYIALEAQNFCFLVLCGLPLQLLSNTMTSKLVKSNSISLSQLTSKPKEVLPNENYIFSVEASIKYFLLSAFSSGVLLFWFSAIYLQTGLSILSFSPKEQGLYSDFALNNNNLSIFLILTALLFKLGAAPIHIWVVQIYTGVKRNLLLYISTAPKLSLFGFWINTFQSFWTDYSVVLFSLMSIILGAFGAYKNPSIRGLLAFSTINEIGLLLSAVECAGFDSLFQHLSIYIISQLLLWNLNHKRLFLILAVSLAGLPPLAGFFGKAWIFWQLSTIGLTKVLFIALLCASISLIYYLRIIRLFWNPTKTCIFNHDAVNRSYTAKSLTQYKVDLNLSQFSIIGNDNRSYLTSFCLILLFILPIFVIKPFIA